MLLSQDILHNAHVMVVGCGALGNEVLKNLTLLGIGRLTIVDFDTVEMGNLTRSVMYRKEDIGRRKVDVMAQRLRELNLQLHIDTIDGDIAHDVGLGMIASCDVVMACVDSRWARFMINRHCMRMGKHWVDGGIGMTEGTVRVFGEGNCYACNLGTDGLNDLHRRMPCSGTIRRSEEAGHAPTNIITAAVTAAVMTQEAVKLLMGEETIQGHMFCYDADTVTGRKAMLEAYDEDCPEHERWEDIVPTEITPQMTVNEVLDALGGEVLTLRDDCFVDYIYDRRDDTRYTMMRAGRKVVDAMDASDELRGRMLGDFYQSEHHTIARGTEYAMMKLEELGIPEHDVLTVDERYYMMR